jgi:hypothetical protein
MMVEYEKPNWVIVSEKYWVFSNISNISIKIQLETITPTTGLNKKPSVGIFNYESQNIYLNKEWQIIDIKEEISIP